MILELNKSCRPLQKISPSPLLELAPTVKTLPSNIKESQHALEFFRDLHFLGRKWWPGHTSFHYEYYIFFVILSFPRRRSPGPHIFLDQRTVGEPSSKTLLRLGELLLTLNCFLFGGNYYKQTNGVAMGPKMRPSYANLYIGVIEHQFLSQ